MYEHGLEEYMILRTEKGKEQDIFIAFIEHALGVLSKEEYTSFLALFDYSRLTEQDLIRALKYLDENRPVLKIDNPALEKSEYQRIDVFAFSDGSGYHMDYDLTTGGKVNDLTIQVEFKKKGNGYKVTLDDLHAL